MPNGANLINAELKRAYNVLSESLILIVSELPRGIFETTVFDNFSSPTIEAFSQAYDFYRGQTAIRKNPKDEQLYENLIEVYQLIQDINSLNEKAVSDVDSLLEKVSRINRLLMLAQVKIANALTFLVQNIQNNKSNADEQKILATLEAQLKFLNQKHTNLINAFLVSIFNNDIKFTAAQLDKILALNPSYLLNILDDARLANSDQQKILKKYILQVMRFPELRQYLSQPIINKLYKLFETDLEVISSMADYGIIPEFDDNADSKRHFQALRGRQKVNAREGRFVSPIIYGPERAEAHYHFLCKIEKRDVNGQPEHASTAKAREENLKFLARIDEDLPWHLMTPAEAAALIKKPEQPARPLSNAQSWAVKQLVKPTGFTGFFQGLVDNSRFSSVLSKLGFSKSPYQTVLDKLNPEAVANLDESSKTALAEIFPDKIQKLSLPVILSEEGHISSRVSSAANASSLDASAIDLDFGTASFEEIYLSISKLPDDLAKRKKSYNEANSKREDRLRFLELERQTRSEREELMDSPNYPTRNPEEVASKTYKLLRNAQKALLSRPKPNTKVCRDNLTQLIDLHGENFAPIIINGLLAHISQTQLYGFILAGSRKFNDALVVLANRADSRLDLFSIDQLAELASRFNNSPLLNHHLLMLLGRRLNGLSPSNAIKMIETRKITDKNKEVIVRLAIEIVKKSDLKKLAQSQKELLKFLSSLLIDENKDLLSIMAETNPMLLFGYISLISSTDLPSKKELLKQIVSLIGLEELAKILDLASKAKPKVVEEIRGELVVAGHDSFAGSLSFRNLAMMVFRELFERDRFDHRLLILLGERLAQEKIDITYDNASDMGVLLELASLAQKSQPSNPTSFTLQIVSDSNSKIRDRLLDARTRFIFNYIKHVFDNDLASAQLIIKTLDSAKLKKLAYTGLNLDPELTAKMLLLMSPEILRGIICNDSLPRLLYLLVNANNPALVVALLTNPEIRDYLENQILLKNTISDGKKAPMPNLGLAFSLLNYKYVIKEGEIAFQIPKENYIPDTGVQHRIQAGPYYQMLKLAFVYAAKQSTKMFGEFTKHNSDVARELAKDLFGTDDFNKVERYARDFLSEQSIMALVKGEEKFKTPVEFTTIAEKPKSLSSSKTHQLPVVPTRYTAGMTH